MITLNLLRNLRANPDLSAYDYVFGPYDLNTSHMAPPGTRVIVHGKPGNHILWVHHVTKGWYIGPQLEHYRCMQCYTPAIGIVIITDNLQYIPKEFDLPKKTT